MHDALAALPGVEKDSIKVSKSDSQATFRINNPQAFKASDAVKAVDEAGFRATLAGAGKAVPK